MSDTVLLLLIVVPMFLALGFGVWVGLGYPGLYDRYEKTGHTSRKTPFEMLVDWFVGKLDRR